MKSRFETLGLASAVLLLFAGAYFAAYGPIARQAGSWKYVIYHHDEYSYWMYAKGATEIPASDGNPFYFEEMGKKQTFPYPTCILIGFLSRLFNVHVFAFHPLWHIGMPFVLWLSLFFSLRKIWGYPRWPSAAFALFFLAITLYLRGLIPGILVRFSRPGDTLWMLFIWISLVMAPDNSPGRARPLLIGLLGALTFWFTPMMFLMGAIVTAGETLYRWIFLKDKRDIPYFEIIYVCFIAGILSYGLYVMIHIADAPWALRVSKVRNLAYDQLMDWAPLVLYGLIAGAVLWTVRTFKTGLSRMDRLLLGVFLIEPVCVNIQAFTSANFQFADHRYYFLVIEMLSLAGWLIEKMPRYIEQKWWKTNERKIIGVMAVLTLGIISNPYSNFFRYALDQIQAEMIIDNSLLILTLAPVFILTVWLYFRVERFKRVISNRIFLAVFLPALTLAGFASFSATYFNKSGYQYPYDRAYSWLNEHAQKDEVALTLSPSRLEIDYLPLFTHLKTYINPIADIIAKDSGDEGNIFRFYFYTSLLYEGEPFLGWDTEKAKLPVLDRIRRLKLNYILMDLDSPFMQNVSRKLDGFLEEVYRDDKSLIWKVRQAA